MSISTVLAVALCAAGEVSKSEVSNPVDLALVPSVSLNLLQAGGPADNVFVLAVLSHRSRKLDGLAIAAGGSWVESRMRGTQLSLFNRAESVEGVQIGAFNFGSEGVNGVQLAGVINFSMANTAGAQLSGVVNVGFESYQGVQIGTANIVGETMTGLQLGALNRAGDVRGAQIGAFNVANHVSGLMLGLVNIADHADVPIGLINWLGDGENHLVLEGSETSYGGVGAKLGNSWLFSHLSFGASRVGQDPRFAFGAGIGARARAGRFVGELEAQVRYLSRGRIVGGSEAMQTSVDLNVGVQILPHLAVLLGPSLNVYVPLDSDAKLDGFMPVATLGRGDRAAQVYPGFQASVQF